jgi:tetratricopeptide (TPR) repeat protein
MKPIRIICLFSLLLSNNFIIAQSLAHAKKLYDSKDFEKAFSAFNAISKSNHDYAESRYYMGLISMQKEDHEKAEEYIQQAISSNPNVAKYHVAMVNVYGQMISKASMLRQASLASKLKTHMESAVNLNPKDMNTSLMLIGFYVRAPRIMGGDKEKAKKLADEIMKINRADGYRAIGLIAHAEEKYSDAESNYKKALNISPDSVKFHYSLASVYQSQSKFDEAMDVYEKAIERFPTNRNLLLVAGRMASYGGEKHSENGVKYLNYYIGENPDMADKNIGEAYYYLGMIEKNRGNKSLARKHFSSALKVNPDHTKSQQALKDMS